MVKRSDNTNNKCDRIRELHCKGNRFERVPEFTVSSNCSNSLCLASYTNHHKKKLVFIFSAMRHFADALAEDGTIRIDYETTVSFGQPR